MSLLGRYRATKAIDELLAAPGPKSARAVEAEERLLQIGAEAIPRLIDSLGSARQTQALEAVLCRLLDDETLPLVTRGLYSKKRQAVEATVRVLSRCEGYEPKALLELFEDPAAPKSPLVQVLLSRTEELHAPSVVRLIDRIDHQALPALLWLIDGVAKESLVPELIRRLESQDSVVRLALVRTLARFSLGEVQSALLQRLLADSHNEVRLAALDGLLALDLPPPLKPLCQLLRDPDMVVQGKGIEALVRLAHPETGEALSSLLRDEKEGVRRAAVEVLVEIGTEAAIPVLLETLRDEDWWVQVRAADALVAIGGLRVAAGVLPLLDHEHEAIRRTALEVLERTRDDATFDFLFSALDDPSATVRARSVRALGILGDGRAVPHLLALLERDRESAPAVIGALEQLGDEAAVEPLLELLESGELAPGEEVLEALDKLAQKPQLGRMLEVLDRVHGRLEDQQMRVRVAKVSERIAERFHATQVVGQSPVPETQPSPDDILVDLSIHQPAPTIIDAQALKPGDVLADRYRILRQVGRGGFGVVVLVEDSMVQDDIILKFLGPKFALDRGMIERFKHELRLARKITHPNVIRIYDLISFGHAFAISMEYFESHSLAAELRGGVALEIGRGLRILAEIASGLAAAHRVGIIHRDLKPGNILIDDELEVKLVDFGLAAAASHPAGRLTRTGSLMGTPTYMPPEQIRGQTLDERSDVYSLGILMYEVFTGRPPYKGSDTMSVLFQHVEGNPRLPREVNAEIPYELERLVLKAMAIDPELRHQSAAELAAELRALSEAAASEPGPEPG